MRNGQQVAKADLVHTALGLAGEPVHVLTSKKLDGTGRGIQFRRIDHNQVVRIFNVGCQGKTQGTAIQTGDVR